MRVSLNDKFVVPNGVAGPAGLQVEVVGLDIDKKFMVSGNGVQNPNQPRELPTIAFVRWLQPVKAQRAAG